MFFSYIHLYLIRPVVLPTIYDKPPGTYLDMVVATTSSVLPLYSKTAYFSQRFNGRRSWICLILLLYVISRAGIK